MIRAKDKDLILIIDVLKGVEHYFDASVEGFSNKKIQKTKFFFNQKQFMSSNMHALNSIISHLQSEINLSATLNYIYFQRLLEDDTHIINLLEKNQIKIHRTLMVSKTK